MARSIGIVECDCLSDVLSATDRMVKAADIRLLRQEQIGNSKVALVFEGDTDEVERALKAAKEKSPEGLTANIVSNVSDRVLGVFNLPGGAFWNRS